MATEKKEGEAKKKARIPTPLKRRKQDDKKTLSNRVRKSKIHTARVAFDKSNNPEEKKTILSTVYSLIDKAVKAGIFKPNKGSRLKSRLSAKTK